MKPFGVSKTPEGLRFAYISGIEDSKKSKVDEIKISQDDLKYVEEQYMLSSERDEDEGLIDVLFTWSWPREMKNSLYRTAPESRRLGPLLWNLKPRYIFAPTHDPILHFERAPYENIDMKSGEFLHPTRFIALSSAEGISSTSNVVKKKWIYAMNLVPSKLATPLALAKRPEDCTTNPFLPVASTAKDSEDSPKVAQNYFFQVNDETSGKRRFNNDSNTAQQLKRPPPGYVCKKCHADSHFFRDCIYKDSTLQPDAKSTYICHICHEPGHHIRNCPKKDEQAIQSTSKSAKTVAPDSCWFCLSNPAARKHLIADIGEEVYLALAKGPLTSEHVIIVPIEHVSSTAADISESLNGELETYMRKVNSLHEGKCAIFFKMSANPTHHFHIQAISIDRIRLFDFLEFLEDFSVKLGYNFKPKQTEQASDSAHFEFSYISEDGPLVNLAHEYDPSAFFPAQYGRQVLAAFLEIEGGADWKTLLHTEDDEKAFVSDLKRKLKDCQK